MAINAGAKWYNSYAYNQPIVTKDADNITQVEVSSLLRAGCTGGPCCPPYLCDFIWQVEALNRDGKPMGDNEGKSGTFTFKVEDKSVTECTPPKLNAPADAKSFLQKICRHRFYFAGHHLYPNHRDQLLIE
ncbi:MAG: hypothetical protein IPL54_00120 [Chitinophagaceae bacterium]|nr:hypothetical protein [Chitinophagaceae bacterium]